MILKSQNQTSGAIITTSALKSVGVNYYSVHLKDVHVKPTGFSVKEE